MINRILYFWSQTDIHSFNTSYTKKIKMQKPKYELHALKITVVASKIMLCCIRTIISWIGKIMIFLKIMIFPIGFFQFKEDFLIKIRFIWFFQNKLISRDWGWVCVYRVLVILCFDSWCLLHGQYNIAHQWSAL